MPAGHDQAAEVRVAQAQRAEHDGCSGRSRVVGIAGVVDQDFLGDEEDPAGRLEPLDVERAVLAGGTSSG